MQTKQAVDATTEDYWEEYFGPYGKTWVRKIPRRVATAVIQRTASKRPGEAAELAATARVIPIMKRPVITKGRVVIEGIVDVTENGRIARRLFSAEFNDEGRLLALDSVPVPLAA